MLPSVARLAIGADAEAPTEPPPPPPPPADASDLPPDLWEKVLAAVTKDEPCDEIVKLCALNRKWAGMCRDGSLYDAANRALGWYGKQGTWPNVLAVYAALMVDPPGDGTPKGYFQAACRALARWDWKTIAPWHPFYAPILLDWVRRPGAIQPYGDIVLSNVPSYLPDYEAIARAFIDHDSASVALHDFDLNHPALKRVALYAIDKIAADLGVAAPAVRIFRERFYYIWSDGITLPRSVELAYEEVVESAVRKYGWNALHWREWRYNRDSGEDEIFDEVASPSYDRRLDYLDQRMRALAGPYTEPLLKRVPPPPPLPPPPAGPPWQ